MKKIYSVVSLSFLVMFLLVSNVNSSSDSVKHNNKKERNVSSAKWVEFTNDDDGNVYSYQKVNIEKDIVQVWKKIVYSDEGRKKYIKWRTSTPKGYDKLSYVTFLNDIDCKKKSKRSLSVIHYDTDSKVLWSYDYDKPKWSHISPDTSDEKLLKEVCK